MEIGALKSHSIQAVAFRSASSCVFGRQIDNWGSSGAFDLSGMEALVSFGSLAARGEFGTVVAHFENPADGCAGYIGQSDQEMFDAIEFVREEEPERKKVQEQSFVNLVGGRKY